MLCMHCALRCACTVRCTVHVVCCCVPCAVHAVWLTGLVALLIAGMDDTGGVGPKEADW